MFNAVIEHSRDSSSRIALSECETPMTPQVGGTSRLPCSTTSAPELGGAPRQLVEGSKPPVHTSGSELSEVAGGGPQENITPHAPDFHEICSLSRDESFDCELAEMQDLRRSIYIELEQTTYQSSETIALPNSGSKELSGGEISQDSARCETYDNRAHMSCTSEGLEMNDWQRQILEALVNEVVGGNACWSGSSTSGDDGVDAMNAQQRGGSVAEHPSDRTSRAIACTTRPVPPKRSRRYQRRHAARAPQLEVPLYKRSCNQRKGVSQRPVFVARPLQPTRNALMMTLKPNGHGLDSFDKTTLEASFDKPSPYIYRPSGRPTQN